MQLANCQITSSHIWRVHPSHASRHSYAPSIHITVTLSLYKQLYFTHYSVGPRPTHTFIQYIQLLQSHLDYIIRSTNPRAKKPKYRTLNTTFSCALQLATEVGFELTPPKRFGCDLLRQFGLRIDGKEPQPSFSKTFSKNFLLFTKNIKKLEKKTKNPEKSIKKMKKRRKNTQKKFFFS